MYRRNNKGPKVNSWRSPHGIWNCLEVRQNTVYKNVFFNAKFKTRPWPVIS